MKRREATESELHRTVAELLDWLLLPPAMYTTFPAGWGKLPRATGGRLKGSGLKAGMPDVMVFYGGKTVGVELKTAKGRLSRDQVETFTLLHEAGVPVYVCREVQDVIAALQTEGIPWRSAIGVTDGYKVTESRSAEESAQGTRFT